MNSEPNKEQEAAIVPPKSKMANVPLSPKEIDFIRTHAVMPGWTDEKIADVLGRKAVTIKKYRMKDGISKHGGKGVHKIDGKKVHKDSINKANISEEDKLELWKEYFKASWHYNRVKKELTKEDLEFFIERWAEYHLQFDELKPTEEATIINLVKLDLRISENSKEYKELQEQDAMLRRQIGGRDLGDMENEEDRLLFEMVNGNNNAKRECNKQTIEMTKSHDSILRGLNATREQREQNERIGADTFPNLVKLLTEENRRIKANEYAEFVRLSEKQKSKELRKPYTFANGEIEPVLLDGADFLKKEVVEEKNEQK